MIIVMRPIWNDILNVCFDLPIKKDGISTRIVFVNYGTKIRRFFYGLFTRMVGFKTHNVEIKSVVLTQMKFAEMMPGLKVTAILDKKSEEDMRDFHTSIYKLQQEGHDVIVSEQNYYE